ncbi:MAG: serine hydrolase [Haliscomenobacter sp.]|nr:serine hydrolase [Haliscomenobacter sp.]
MLELGGWIGGDGIRQKDALTMVRHLRELNFKPGDQYAYCNTAYMLLGEIIGRTGGKPFEVWMRENIFDPLGMRDTYVMDIQGELFPNCAESYGANGRASWVKIYDNSTAFGQGGIYTTLPDLAKWADNFRTGKVGGESGLRQMAQRGVLNNGDTLSYAFGIEHGRHGSLALLQHSGASAGYRAMLTYVPEHGMAILMKANFAGFQAETFVQKALQILFPEEQKRMASISPVQETSKPAEPQLSAEQLAAYAGTYFCPELEAYYRIRLENGQLTLNQRRLGDFTLKPSETDRFETSAGFKLQFERDKKSRLTGFRISNSRVLRLWVEKQKE